MTTIPRSLIKTRNRCSGFIVIPRKCYIMETEKELVFFLFFSRRMVSPASLIAVNLQHPPTFLISPAGRWGKALSSGTSLQLLIGTRRVREHAESHVFVMWKADSDSPTNGPEFSSSAVWCKSAARTVVQRFNDGWCAHTTFYQTDQSSFSDFSDCPCSDSSTFQFQPFLRTVWWVFYFKEEVQNVF